VRHGHAQATTERQRGSPQRAEEAGVLFPPLRLPHFLAERAWLVVHLVVGFGTAVAVGIAYKDTLAAGLF
jgi:hypothetical protein